MAEKRAGRRQRGRKHDERSTAQRTSPAVIAGRAAACAVSLTVLGASGFAWYEVGNLSDGLTTSSALDDARRDAPPHLDKSVNLLLIGLDSRKDMDGNDLPPSVVSDELHAGSSSDIGGYNTNALIVLHIPANGGKVQALSVPRDDYVQTYGADGRMHKIKEAYDYAKSAADQRLSGKGLSKAELERQSREAGRSATIQTVQRFLNIPIDHFAEVNLIGFYDVARALQPIRVCLNHPVNDPIISRTVGHEGGGTGLRLPAGYSDLDAPTALSFVRQRHNLPNGDLDRTHRQQAFISSVEYKLRQQGVFGDLGQLQKLFDVIKKDAVIDNQWKILDFAQQAPNLTGGNVEFNTLPITGFKTVNGQEVNTVNADLIRRIVQQLFGHDQTPAPTATADAGSTPDSAPPTAGAAGDRSSDTTVDVYNASSVAHAAANESAALVAMGFKAGRTGEGTAHPRTTTVAYGSGARDGAQQVAARYGVTPTAASAVPPGHVAVTLGAGYTAPDSGGGDPSTASSTGTSTRAGAETGATSDSSSTLPMQGPAVKAGGIPCVD